jgi:hypothetical protein
MGPSEALAARVRAGHELLRSGRAAEAIPVLEAVAHDPDLARATDLQDIRAHVMSLWVEACLEAKQLDSASTALIEAESLARRIDDDRAKENLAWLRGRLSDAKVERRVEAVVMPDDTPVDPAEAARAVVAADASGNVRDRVLSRLILARSDRARAADELARAGAIATEAAESALLAAVVRTSELLGVALPAEPFGGKPS